jgi:mono/diheme cytochrome c family protein
MIDVGASVLARAGGHRGPRGDGRPRLSGRAKARKPWCEPFATTNIAELRSAGQPGAAVPTWLVMAPARARALAPTLHFLLLLALLALAGCRQDMHDQPRFKPLAESDFYTDLRSARPPVEGTVARGQLHEDNYLYTGKLGDNPGDYMPFPVTDELLARGQQRYDIYCAPCHSRVGDGNGVIPARGFPRKPPSYHIERLRKAPLGYLFDVITSGFGSMPDYSAQIAPRDRWAIVAYIRALQLSQSATAADVPSGQKVPSEPPQFEQLGSGATLPVVETKPTPEEPK